MAIGFSPYSLTGCVLMACYLATPVNSEECPSYYSIIEHNSYHYCSGVCCDDVTPTGCCEWVYYRSYTTNIGGFSRGEITGIVFGSIFGLVVLILILGAIGTCISSICEACPCEITNICSTCPCESQSTSTRQATVHPANEISTV